MVSLNLAFLGKKTLASGRFAWLLLSRGGWALCFHGRLRTFAFKAIMESSLAETEMDLRYLSFIVLGFAFSWAYIQPLQVALSYLPSFIRVNNSFFCWYKSLNWPVVGRSSNETGVKVLLLFIEGSFLDWQSRNLKLWIQGQRVCRLWRRNCRYCNITNAELPSQFPSIVPKHPETCFSKMCSS